MIFLGFFSSFYVILALFLGIVAARTPAFRPAQAQLITWGGAAGALFCMGVRIACDPVVRGELAGLGVTALAVSAAATAGSVMAVPRSAYLYDQIVHPTTEFGGSFCHVIGEKGMGKTALSQ